MLPLRGREALRQSLGLVWSPGPADTGLGVTQAPPMPGREKFCPSSLFPTLTPFRPGKGWAGQLRHLPFKSKPLGEVFKCL